MVKGSSPLQAVVAPVEPCGITRPGAALRISFGPATAPVALGKPLSSTPIKRPDHETGPTTRSPPRTNRSPSLALDPTTICNRKEEAMEEHRRGGAISGKL